MSPSKHLLAHSILRENIGKKKVAPSSACSVLFIFESPLSPAANTNNPLLSSHLALFGGPANHYWVRRVFRWMGLSLSALHRPVYISVNSQHRLAAHLITKKSTQDNLLPRSSPECLTDHVDNMILIATALYKQPLNVLWYWQTAAADNMFTSK